MGQDTGQRIRDQSDLGLCSNILPLVSCIIDLPIIIILNCMQEEFWILQKGWDLWAVVSGGLLVKYL
jgi:hypothetical protein